MTAPDQRDQRAAVVAIRQRLAVAQSQVRQYQREADELILALDDARGRLTGMLAVAKTTPARRRA